MIPALRWEMWWLECEAGHRWRARVTWSTNLGTRQRMAHVFPKACADCGRNWHRFVTDEEVARGR